MLLSFECAFLVPKVRIPLCESGELSTELLQSLPDVLSLKQNQIVIECRFLADALGVLQVLLNGCSVNNLLWVACQLFEQGGEVAGFRLQRIVRVSLHVMFSVHIIQNVEHG